MEKDRDEVFAELEMQRVELEAEMEDMEFGSLAWDVASAELQRIMYALECLL